MKGYVTDIERETLQNEHFRKVLYTATYMQLVVMSVPMGGEIGEEVHGQDQFIRVESGSGKALLDDTPHDLSDGAVVVIPAGTKHNILNTGEIPLKLYTIYAMPHHKDGVVHHTREEADRDEEEFLGDTTE